MRRRPRTRPPTSRRKRKRRRRSTLTTTTPEPEVLSTTVGDLPLEEVALELGGRAFSILHTRAILTHADEEKFLRGEELKLPYGIALWPAALALAHELAARELKGKSVLELGAGTGLPGIVAASRGAQVVQTDRQELVLHLCRKNAERNQIGMILHRIADWTAWDVADRFDLIIGSDILYAAGLHPYLRHIFETNLAPGGRLLIGDPFRESSVYLLEQMEAAGWKVGLSKFTLGERRVGVFDLTR
jgi:predicted nicotinamide N-methyase